MTAHAAGPVMLPMSFAQELMWLQERASPGNVAYNVPRTRRLVGHVDAAALRRAFDGLVARHEILRTTYAFDGDHPVQVIHPPAPATFDMIDLSQLGEAERDAAVRAEVGARASRPFDLAREAPFRVVLIRLADSEHVLHIDTHHIAADGWSRDVMYRDLDALYRAALDHAAPSLAPLPIQYADFAVWQREQIAGERLEELLRYWRGELGDAEFVLHLPTDLPRPPVPGSGGVTTTVDIEGPELDRLRRLARAGDASLYMTLLAGYAALLHRYTGSRDVLIGSPVAARTLPETEGLIGCLANTVVQRGRFAGDPTFLELLQQVRTSALAAHEHQEVPFERLVLEFELQQSLAHSPLFQVVFTMLDTSAGNDQRLGDVIVAPYRGEAATTKFDLTLFMAERPDRLTLVLRGRTDLFLPATVETMLGRLVRLLLAAAADPSARVAELPLLSPRETALIGSANATAVEWPAPDTLTAMIEDAADRVPDATAVVAEDATLGYADLDRAANRLAHHLLAMGVTAGSPVGLCLDRSAEAVVAMLAILKAGCCFVPLAPDAPPERIARQVAICGAATVVTCDRYRDRLPAGARIVAVDGDGAPIAARRDARPGSVHTGGDLAYMMFTSGSTGEPKGVAVTHANIVNYVRGIARVLSGRSDPADASACLGRWAFGMISPLSADLGYTALFPPLVSGGSAHLIPDAAAVQSERFADYLREHRIDVLKITPGHFKALLGDRRDSDARAVLPREWLIMGGESLSWQFARQLLAAGDCRLLNHYGPTETTVGAATFAVTTRDAGSSAATVPIGGPLANVQLHVLDDHRQPVPPGVPGELWIGGAGVARGYHGRDALTSERFVELAGLGRCYRTGDRVRRLASGEIEFLGRVDRQMKVRGFRVEPGEIEQVLNAVPGVSESVVELRAADGADARLVGYVVPRAAGYASAHAERPTPERLRAAAGERLPSYMVPDAIVMLDRIPRTRNGKVDRAALPDPGAASSAPQRRAPVTATETALHQIWADALKREPDSFGVGDDFLALGGHSLVAIRILGKISRQFGLRLPLRTLFEAPRIDRLAELVDLEVQMAALDRLEAAGRRPPGDPVQS